MMDNASYIIYYWGVVKGGFLSLLRNESIVVRWANLLHSWEIIIIWCIKKGGLQKVAARLSYGWLFQVEGVSHPFLFGLQIAIVIGVGSDLDGYVLHDFQSVGLQSNALGGVVGHEPHLVDA